MAGTAIDHLALSVLDNVSSVHDTIELMPNVTMVSLGLLSEDRARRLLEQHETVSSEYYLPGSVTAKPTHALLYQFQGTVPDPFREHYDLMFGAGHAFDNVLAAFQIVKEGVFNRYPNHETVAGIEAFLHLADPFIFSQQPEQPYVAITGTQPPYRLDDEDEIAFVRKILETIQGNSLPTLRIVLTRLNKQFTRTDFADKFIDAVIALEALYLYGTSDELRYRLGVRVAAHLGRDAAEKQHLYDLTSLVYQIRSKLAHGELYTITETNRYFKGILDKHGWVSVEEVLDELIEVLRRAVRSILVEIGEQRFKAHFHQALDKAILTSSTFKVEDLPG